MRSSHKWQIARQFCHARTARTKHIVSVSPRSNEGPLLTGGSDMYFAPSRPKDFLEIKKNPRNAAGIEPATLAGQHSPTLYRYTMPPTPKVTGVLYIKAATG